MQGNRGVEAHVAGAWGDTSASLTILSHSERAVFMSVRCEAHVRQSGAYMERVILDAFHVEVAKGESGR